MDALPEHMGHPLPPHMFPYEHMGIHEDVSDIRATQESLKQKTDELFVHSTLLSKNLLNYGNIVSKTTKGYIKLVGLVGDSLNEESTGLIHEEKDRLGSMSEVTKEIEEVTKKGRQDPSDAKLPDEVVQAADLQHIDAFERGAESHALTLATPGNHGTTDANHGTTDGEGTDANHGTSTSLPQGVSVPSDIEETAKEMYAELLAVEPDKRKTWYKKQALKRHPDKNSPAVCGDDDKQDQCEEEKTKILETFQFLETLKCTPKLIPGYEC